MTLAEAMRPIRPGLWWWTVPHPDWHPWDPTTGTGWDWSPEAGCVCYEGPQGLVLIDPLTPAADTPAHEVFWRALDDEVRRQDRPLTVLLTCDWHERSAQAICDRYQARYGASLWGPAVCATRGSSGGYACRPTHTFDVGDALPGGAEAYLAAWNPEVLLYLPGSRALFVADSLWSPPDSESETAIHLTVEEARPVLGQILETRSVEVLLLSHCLVVSQGAHEALTRLLEQPARPPWGR
jgi:hypothetical protein